MTVTIDFSYNAPPSPPLNGYRLRYRLQSSTSAYTTIFSSAFNMQILNVALGTSYEYILDSDCGNGIFSNGIPGIIST